MNTLSQIYNESYGYKVATNADFVAIANPTTRFYDPCSGEGIVGEVYLIRKNKFNNNYEKILTYKQKPASYWGFLYSYTTESGSAGLNGITSSLNYESSSLDSELTTCSFLTIENNTSQILLSEFGKSIDLSDYDLAVADTNYSESFYGNYTYTIQSAVVNIYEIAERNPSLTCLSESKYNYTQSDAPRCVITGSVTDEFGTSVSISNTYLAIGAPNYTNGSGSVYVYKYDETCGYALLAHLSSSDQTRFGYSIALDKKNEDKLIIGNDNISDNQVYIYSRDTNDNWTLFQTLTHNTSSTWIDVDENLTEFSIISQSNDKYGYSVDIHDNIVVVGAPKDLMYYEYSGSSKIRERGSAYVYVNNSECNVVSPDTQYKLFDKIYGDKFTFKDNLLGYSVATKDNKILVGSPKPYFPFSSAYLSASIYRYNKDFNEDDLGESTYNGQVLLYEYISSSATVSQMTSAPIAYRKKTGESYSAYGHSVDISNENIVVGSPILLNNDRYLETPYLLEDSGSGPTTCSLNTVDVLQILVEDDLSECTGCSTTNVVLVTDQPVISEIEGKSFIYDFKDLQTDYVVGNTFYNNNKAVINNSGSIIGDFLKDPIDFDDIYVNMEYKSQLTLNEQQFICTVEPGEFNVSTNVTATTKQSFNYAISNEYTFDFETLDIILRYINSKITKASSEYWWDTFIEGDVEESIHAYYSSMIHNYTNNILTEDLKCELAKKDFDINNDGRVDILDGNLLWKYFIGKLTINTYKEYLNIQSQRNNYDDIIKFLDTQTGKLNKQTINSEFFAYDTNSSLDPTGSYLAPYITTVGLYSGADLVAVAKLAHPIKNTGEIPINIVVKWYN